MTQRVPPPGDARDPRRSSRERLVARSAWALAPAALVVALAALGKEHAGQFLFVPVLGIAVVALAAGIRVAIVATSLTVIACAYALFAPTRSIAVHSGFELLRLLGVAAVSLVLSWAIGSLRGAYGHAARQQAALERAVALRDEVLAVVSHDLRGPITSIRLSADALARIAERVPEVARHSARIVSGAEQMNRLIHDLLDAASIDAGRLSVHTSDESAAEIAREAVERARTAGDAAEVRVALGRLDRGPVPARCDRDRVLQALGNLLDNAIKATAPGGSVEVDVTARTGAVAIAVRDTGSGIAPEDLPHVFDRFRRGAGARHHGAGLGLAIVKGIAVAHGGAVRVESRLGAGTTIELSLPMAPAELGERAATA